MAEGRSHATEQIIEGRTLERVGLSEQVVREVHSLVAQCAPVHVNIILEAVEGWQFLRYQGDRMVGVLGLRRDGEACLCVAPSARRQGIGRELIGAADARLVREGMDEMVVECDASSADGQAFLRAMGGTLRDAEFRLRLSEPSALPASTGRVDLVRVGPHEIESFARAAARSFGDESEETVSDFVGQLGDSRHRFYLARVEGSGVGGMRVSFHGDETHLTQFHTLPEARRRGYGRDLLLQTCRALLAEGKEEILLEVRTDNEAALQLYRSCGFELVRRYDFYTRRVPRTWDEGKA